MNFTNNYIIGIFVFLGIIVVIVILYFILRNPFKKYDPIIFDLDVSGKKSKSKNDYVDMLINDKKNILSICNNHKNEYKYYINELREKYKKNKYRLKQIKEVENTITDLITIDIIRKQTRYHQQNYVRTSYIVRQVVDSVQIGFYDLQVVYCELQTINFEMTRSEFFSKDQRKLMTPELRNRVKIRDNFTCQCCGKVMRDEVGLHIDHIVPVSRGGRSVLSNLQVLCDKCNLSKGGK